MPCNSAAWGEMVNPCGLIRYCCERSTWPDASQQAQPICTSRGQLATSLAGADQFRGNPDVSVSKKKYMAPQLFVTRHAPGRASELVRLDRLLDRFQRFRFRQLLVVVVQRIAAGDQAVARPGRTVAERAADPLPLQLPALSTSAGNSG